MGTTNKALEKKINKKISKSVTSDFQIGDNFCIDIKELDSIFTALKEKSFDLIGPTVKEQTIAFDQIESVKDLPEGYTDEQSPGIYRVKKTDSKTLFNFTTGSNSLKKYLYPPHHTLWTASRNKGNFTVKENIPNLKPLAIIGLRACDLKAMFVQDRVLTQGEYKDSYYQLRRNSLFIVAVNCSRSVSTCFCTSMGSGPSVTNDFDLALTELITNTTHKFRLEVGSDKGLDVVKNLKFKAATNKELNDAKEVIKKTTNSITRQLDLHHLDVILKGSHDHKIWDEIGKECLNCGNCTMACPTCFCHTLEDTTDLTGSTAQRTRRWDSCFTIEFSYLHGGSVRTSSGARYRHWMTHKLATWIEQFDMSGCVGCGRCITWCPVGIDITEVAQTLRQTVLDEAHAVAWEEI